MNAVFAFRDRRLSGRFILLSASIPSKERADKYRRVSDSAIKIQEAVSSLARAVFSEDGRLVFGGHPSISPLIALVAGEYFSPLQAKFEPPIQVYQSKAFEGHLPDETVAMHRWGYAHLTWTEAVAGEKFDPKVGVQSCDKSLAMMRSKMIAGTRPIAMVCIGGMEGVEAEADLFERSLDRAPIYVLSTTGGASSLLAHACRQNERYRVLDEEALTSTKTYIPYPLIMQTLVNEIVERTFS